MCRKYPVGVARQARGTSHIASDAQWRRVKELAAGIIKLTGHGIMEDPGIDLVKSPDQLWVQWMRSADTKQASPKLWMDADRAAFAFTGGNRLVSIDKAFKQFPRVDVGSIR